MRSRKWISVIALLGVLLHAGVIVRHNAVMTSATLQYHALLADIAQLCHGGRTPSDGLAELPYIPRPSDLQSTCPICSGLAPGVAIGAPEIVTTHTAFEVAVAVATEPRFVPVCNAAFYPPVRGPPALA